MTVRPRRERAAGSKMVVRRKGEENVKKKGCGEKIVCVGGMLWENEIWWASLECWVHTWILAALKRWLDHFQSHLKYPEPFAQVLSQTNVGSLPWHFHRVAQSRSALTCAGVVSPGHMVDRLTPRQNQKRCVPHARALPHAARPKPRCGYLRAGVCGVAGSHNNRSFGRSWLKM